jgi:hypothetical protein
LLLVQKSKEPSGVLVLKQLLEACAQLKNRNRDYQGAASAFEE